MDEVQVDETLGELNVSSFYDNLDDLLDRIDRLKAKAPEGTEVLVRGYACDDDGYLTLYYKRGLTPAETALRTKQVALLEAQERSTYLRLKAKYK